MSDAEAGRPNYALLVSRLGRSRQWDRVLDAARQWLSLDPENTRAHQAAGHALVNLVRWPEAEAHLVKVLQKEPRNHFVHRLISMVHFNQKRFKAADEAIQQAISIQPNDAYNWFHLARMFYYQNDRQSAQKFALKARALAPRDADILNLIAICQPAASLGKRQQLEQALELNPQNAFVHNNLGLYYLNSSRDYAQAEKCFRRALFFNPALKSTRTNLFITIRHQDRMYRALCAPRKFIYRFQSRFRRPGSLVRVCWNPIAMGVLLFMLAVFALWFCLSFPLVKAYEFLTIGDIRASAGEIGARQGGFLNYRRWTLKQRLSVFALLLVIFWGGTVWLVISYFRHLNLADGQSLLANLLWQGACMGLVIFVGISIRNRIKRDRFKIYTRKRAKRLGHLLENSPRRKSL